MRIIEAYRRAVGLNPRDYRAWYGLGQTYELLHMPFYALNYFRRATQVCTQTHAERYLIARMQASTHGSGMSCWMAEAWNVLEIVVLSQYHIMAPQAGARTSQPTALDPRC